MPQVEHVATTTGSVDAVWGYVSDMDNWAPFVKGYQSHRVESDRRSLWVVKGDVGPLARTVHLAVEITEWRDRELVSFCLTGIDEQFEGTGSFTLVPLPGRPAEGTGGIDGTAPRRQRRQPLRSLRYMVGRWTRARSSGRRARTARAGSAGQPADPAHSPVHRARSQLTFELHLTAGGMMGPVVNAMIEPLLRVAARDLADSLTAAVEAQTPPPARSREQ